MAATKVMAKLDNRDCVVQSHCDLSANMHPALSCNDLCDQMMSVQGE